MNNDEIFENLKTLTCVDKWIIYDTRKNGVNLDTLILIMHPNQIENIYKLKHNVNDHCIVNG